MSFRLLSVLPLNRRRIAAVGGLCLVGILLLAQFEFFGAEYWSRGNPLSNPVAISSVQNGTIRLVDGRSFRPAGVRLRPGVTPTQLDEALRVMTAQGIVVDRDMGDGRAFLTVEPKFYNWCGTRGFNGLWWSRWAGGYFQFPLSPLLVHAEYAEAAFEENGLTPKECWRLDGSDHIRGYDSGPMRISSTSHALRFDGSVSLFQNLDEMLENQNPSPLK